MKSSFETRRLTRSIRGLFGAKKRPSPHKRFPKEYYKSVWLTKEMHDCVEVVARIEGISNKKASDMLVGLGISKYLEEHGMPESMTANDRSG